MLIYAYNKSFLGVLQCFRGVFVVQHNKYKIALIFLVLFAGSACIARKRRVARARKAKKQAFRIGQKELDALNVQYDIEREVAKYWRPPADVSKKLLCTANVVVDQEGKVQKVTVIKSSGLSIYDISAKAAVAKMSFPKSVWGKEVNITFNQ